MFGIADDFLAVDYDSNAADHDNTLQRVLHNMQKGLKLNKEKHCFRCTSVPFFGEIISRQGMGPDLRKLKVLADIPPPMSK